MTLKKKEIIEIKIYLDKDQIQVEANHMVEDQVKERHIDF
jgi:hypothetical protein